MWWTSPVLLIAIISISSAATAFNAITDISVNSKCACRMQVSTAVLFVMQLHEWMYRHVECKRLWQSHMQAMVSGGICFGLCFIVFTEGLHRTSMSHCLILGSSCPLFLLAHSYMKGQHVTRLEQIGAVISFIGIVVISLAKTSETKATLYGDALSLSFAALYSLFLIISRSIVKDADLPVLHYFFGINAIGCVVCFLSVLLIVPEEASFFFTWMTTSDWALIVYMGIVPGILGHLVFNVMLKHVSTILITIFGSLESPLGSFIGWCFGFQEIPPIWTWIGGVMCIVGCTIVTLGGVESSQEYAPLPTKDTELKSSKTIQMEQP